MICQMYNIYKFITEVNVDERKVSERSSSKNVIKSFMICQMYNIYKFITEVKVDEWKVSELNSLKIDWMNNSQLINHWNWIKE